MSTYNLEVHNGLFHHFNHQLETITCLGRLIKGTSVDQKRA